MNVLSALILVFSMLVLAIWLLPGWGILVAQFRSFFQATGPGAMDLPAVRPLAPRVHDQHIHATPTALTPQAKRHTVLPHQARGR